LDEESHHRDIGILVVLLRSRRGTEDESRGTAAVAMAAAKKHEGSSDFQPLAE
jgi:hypothetical protein